MKTFEVSFTVKGICHKLLLDGISKIGVRNMFRAVYRPMYKEPVVLNEIKEEIRNENNNN